MIILIIGSALVSLSLVLGGCYSDTDIDIRRTMIASGIALLIAIVVLVLLAPMTGLFSDVSGEFP